MFRWGKSSKAPAPAVAGGEVAVHKVVEKIDYVNLVHIKPPVQGGGGAIGNASWKAQPWTAAKKPESTADDINSKAGRFIEDTKNRWRLGLKSFRATGRR